MRFQSLPEWLSWQETLHFTDVDPGLERIGQVWDKLNISEPLPFKIVTVAGTNGKGSSVALLDAILRAGDYRVGTYTSPHLRHYNERIVVDGQPCSDEQICAAFARIDDARGDVSLTYFEFATLAALLILIEQEIDIALLEVGMGGRLDAVNLVDADIALITPVGLDHTQWLGHDRETIAREKAGIIRMARPVVCSETEPAQSLLTYADECDAPVHIAGQAFNHRIDDLTWSWSNARHDWPNLPYPALAGEYQFQNASAVLQVVSLLEDLGFVLPIEAICTGLKQVCLLGRFQTITGDIPRILDVTHNQQGAMNLFKLLAAKPIEGETYAVMGMLQDKDVQKVVTTLSPAISSWFIGGLDNQRGLSGQAAAEQALKVVREDAVQAYQTVPLAYEAAMLRAQSGDRVLVFGSFHTVGAVMEVMEKDQT